MVSDSLGQLFLRFIGNTFHNNAIFQETRMMSVDNIKTENSIPLKHIVLIFNQTLSNYVFINDNW